MTVISVNSTSHHQTAPTTIIDSNGYIVSEAPRGEEYLIVYDYNTPTIGYGAKGRIHYSLELLGEDTSSR